MITQLEAPMKTSTDLQEKYSLFPFRFCCFLITKKLRQHSFQKNRRWIRSCNFLANCQILKHQRQKEKIFRTKPFGRRQTNSVLVFTSKNSLKKWILNFFLIFEKCFQIASKPSKWAPKHHPRTLENLLEAPCILRTHQKIFEKIDFGT